MRTIMTKVSEGIATIAALWLGYNMFIMYAVAGNKQQAYIPYLQFPAKLMRQILISTCG